MAFVSKVGAGGAPTNIRSVGRAFLDEAPFVSCLREWRLPAPAGEAVRVEFDWVHGRGWVALRVMGRTFGQRITIAHGVGAAQR